MKSFIVPLLETILRLLRHISLFGLIRRLFKRQKWASSYAFVDTWVLVHLILSLAVLYLYQYMPWRWLQWLVVIFAALRLLELVVYQLSVLLVDQFHKKIYALGGYRRILVLSIMNYIEILAWFSLFYHHWSSWFDDKSSVLSSPAGALYFSLVTMSTLGYGEVTPLNDQARSLVVIQTIVGVFLLVLIISRTISYLPKPKTLDENEISQD